MRCEKSHRFGVVRITGPEHAESKVAVRCSDRAQS